MRDTYLSALILHEIASAQVHHARVSGCTQAISAAEKRARAATNAVLAMEAGR